MPALPSTSGAIALNQDALGRYFDFLERTLRDNNLEDKPCQIINMDETGMPLNLQPLKDVFPSGEKTHPLRDPDCSKPSVCWWKVVSVS